MLFSTGSTGWACSKNRELNYEEVFISWLVAFGIRLG